MRVRATLAGISLVEVLVAVGLMATAAMLILSLLPSGVLSLKQSENIQTATQFGLKLIEESTQPGSFPVHQSNLTYQANGSEFTATRDQVEVVPPDGSTPRLYDTTVTVTWRGANRPLVFTLRRLKASN